MTLAEKNRSPYVRVIWIGFDQLLAAITNFLVVWICLTSLPTEAFGGFSYTWSTIALFVVLSRALFGIPALLDSESNDPAQAVNFSASLTGTLVLGAITATSTLALYVLSGVVESETWILGLFLVAPVILLQDQIRYLSIATKRIEFAILLDLLVFCCILVTVITARNNIFVGWHLILGLAIGYSLAASIFVIYNPIKITLSNLISYLRIDYHRRSRLVSDAFLAWGFGLIAITLIRIASGDSGIAIYNGLVFLFGPISLVTVFLILGLQSEVVRTKGNLATRHKVLLVAVSFSPIIWMLMIISTPENFLENLLGPSLSMIMANITIFAIAGAFLLGIEILNLFLRASGDFGAVTRLRLVTGVIGSIALGIATFLDLEISYLISALALSYFVGLTLTITTLRKIFWVAL